MLYFIIFLRRRSNSGVMCKLGSELPSNVVSSFTKPKCQTPFTGLITCKVGAWWNDLLLDYNLVIVGDACFPFSDTRSSLLFFLQQYHPLSPLLQVQHKEQEFLPPSWFLKYLSPALVLSAWTPFCRCLSVKSGYQPVSCMLCLKNWCPLFVQVEGGALKQNTFGKLPECLCFHVQVFCTLCIFLKMIMNI